MKKSATALSYLFLLLATTALGVPLEVRQSKMDPGLFVWEATDWVVGCSPAACGWGFNISAPASYIASAPEFKMTCGALYGYPWTDCRPMDGSDFELPAGSNVQAWWPYFEDEGEDSFTVRVAHTWFDAQDGATWNATGTAKATRQTTAFGVTGKRVEGVVEGAGM